jgi:hypothetical protein
MKYVVTGVNRLTGEREAISSPHSEWKAYDLMQKYKGLQLKTGKESAYTRLKVQPACTEGELIFSNND